MSSYKKLESFSPESFYNPKNKLALYVMDRSREAFLRAKRRRARVKTAEELYKYQAQNKKSILKSLGDIPYDRALPLNARVTGSFTHGDLTVEKILFESRPGVFVTANLYLPTNIDGKIPAVLFQPGHAASGKAYEAYSRVCTTLSSAGIAVLAIDPIGQGERCMLPVSAPVKEHQYFGNRAWLAGESLAAYFLADAMRALDYLETRPEIDASRIGATGSSGGGTMTALLAATDDRIKAAAPGTFITDREIYLYADNPQDAEQIWFGATARLFDHVELVTCMCPKPYMILAVDSDFFCIEGSERTYSEAKRLYGILGASDRIEMTVDSSTHAYTAPLAEAAAEFFVKVFFGKSERVGALAPPTEDMLRVLEGRSVFEIAGAITAEEEILRHYDSARSMPSAKAEKRLEKAVFGGRAACEPKLRRISKFCGDGYEAEMLLWFSQPRMPSYGVLIKNKEEKSENIPVTVCLWADGTNAIDLHSEEISRILASGRAVFIPDLVGIGKCTSDRINGATGSFAYDARVKYNADLMFLGDSYGALFAYELCRAIDMLRVEYCTDVALYTVGSYSIYADLLERMGYKLESELSRRVTAEEMMRDDQRTTSEFMDVMLYGVAKFLK